jgi:hypothetical protein
MFDVNESTMAVTLHKGDTGAYTVTIELDDGEEFVDGDVAIYEVWQGTNMLIHRAFNLQPDEPTYTEYGNGVFLIAFRNSDTDTWATGNYNTEIRVSLNPIRSSGAVVDGDTVRTMVQSTITVQPVWIQI